MVIIIVLLIKLILWDKLLINSNQSMDRKCTTRKEVEQIIKSLKTEKSYGYDEIST
jgi:hypothetical protein